MKFVATVAEHEKPNIQVIADKFRAMGANVERVMKITGIITGSMDATPIEKLKIKGVTSVEKDGVKNAIHW